jgi:DNA replicative helicase MCM subunit Mcm2 (Cdc46/Mcm family)
MKKTNHLKSSSYLVIFCFLVLVSCTKTVEVDINPKDSYQYFPIEAGDFKLFQKVTYSYAVGQAPRIDSVLVKEIVKSETKDNNETYYVIERQTKRKNDLFFKPELVYQIITNPKQVIKAERNVYTILLYYPIFAGAKWNINEINGKDENEVEIVENGKLPTKLITDKNIIRVLGDSTNNFIDFKVNQKIFAKNIGEIYSEATEIEYCQEDNCIRKYKIESGKREFITLLEYGKN